MNNRTIRHNILRRQRLSIRIRNIPSRRHAQHIKLARQTCSNASLNAVIRPPEEIEIPQRRIVQSDSWDGAENVKFVAFTEDGRIETLTVGVVGLVVGCAGHEVVVCGAVDADEEAFDAGEEGVVVACFEV